MNQLDHKVRDLLHQATVIDGHSDILIPLADGKMHISEKVTIPKLQDWAPPPGMENQAFVKFGFEPHTMYFGCMGQYDIPRWKEGGINTQLCAIFLDDSKLDAPFKKGMEMAWAFHKNIQENEQLVHCLTAADIRRAKAAGKVGWVLTFEGCEALGGDIRMLDLYHQLGVRAASLTHTRRNIFADGCWAAEKQGGLSPLGRQLIQRMQELNIVIDLVHIGEPGFWEIMELAEKPLILSHSTPTMFASTLREEQDFMNGKVPRPRLEIPRDKAMMEAIVKNGGVLGMIWILYQTLEAAIDDIETALEIMGKDHIGLGSDLYGQQLATPGLEDISKLPNLIRAMVKRGHSDETIIAFLGENYLRVFEQVWGE